MTSTNVNPSQEAVRKFNSLDIDDRLGVLALTYQQVAGSIPADAIASASSDVSSLVNFIAGMSHERQVDALRDLLPAKRTDQNETTLDPNPSKALTELVSGGNTVPTGEYGSMKPEAKLAFWYQVAQRLGNGIVAIPSDYSPASEVTQLVSSIKSMNSDQVVSFLTKVM